MSERRRSRRLVQSAENVRSAYTVGLLTLPHGFGQRDLFQHLHHHIVEHVATIIKRLCDRLPEHLGQAVFPLLRGDRLLGERYAERRQRMKQTQATVAAMRKLLVVVWGAHRSAAAFNPARVYRCASQFALAA